MEDGRLQAAEASENELGQQHAHGGAAEDAEEGIALPQVQAHSHGAGDELGDDCGGGKEHAACEKAHHQKLERPGKHGNARAGRPDPVVAGGLHEDAVGQAHRNERNEHGETFFQRVEKCLLHKGKGFPAAREVASNGFGLFVHFITDYGFVKLRNQRTAL